MISIKPFGYQLLTTQEVSHCVFESQNSGHINQSCLSLFLNIAYFFIPRLCTLSIYSDHAMLELTDTNF